MESGENPETKKNIYASHPMRKTIICLFPRDEGESLPHLEWKHWRMMCLEERSLRKTKRIKVQGAEAKGNTLAKWEEMPSFSFLKWKGEEHHNYMTVKFYTEGVENWDLICSHWQPPHPGLSMNCQQVSASRDTCTGKKCGQPTGTMESYKHDHRTGRFKFGAHLVLNWAISSFLISPPGLFCRCPA